VATVASMMAVLSRALSAGVLAGALSGVAAVLVFVVASAFHPAAGTGVAGSDLAGGAILYLVLAVLLGAAAGAALGLPVGAALGLLRRHLTTHGRARLATALLCLAAVLALGSVLATLGTAAGYLHLLIGPAAVVAPLVGAWRAPRVLALPAPEPEQFDDDDTDVLPPSTDPGRHRRRPRP
jgi:hypothetical protein